MSYRHYYGLLMIASLLMVVSVIIMPKKNEIALMQLQDGHLKNAFSTYAELINKGDNSMNVVIPLSQLYVQYGDILSSVRLIEGFVRDYPKAVDARRRLGKSYQDAQMTYAYQQNLEELARQQPSNETLRELVSHYDFHHDYDKQMQALDQLIHVKDYRFRESDYVTLAKLYAARGRLHEALGSLQLLHELTSNEMSLEAASLLVSLLLDVGTPQNAETFARLYVEERKDPTLAIHLASQFRESGQPAIAVALLTPFLRDNRHPDLLGEFVSASIDQGKNDEIVFYLKKQMEAGVVADTIPETLVAYGLRQQDTKLLAALPEQLVLKSLPDYLLIRYAEFAVTHQVPAIAASVKKNLGLPFLTNAPFLSALLSLGEAPTDKAVTQFMAVQQSMVLTSAEKLSAITIYHLFHKSHIAFALLRTIPARDMLENIDLVTVANYYLSLGAVEEGMQLFEQERLRAGQSGNRDLVYALLLIAAGSGNMDKYQALASDPTVTTQMLDDSYSMATKYQKMPVALAAAALLYKKEPVAKYQLQLAEAYSENKQYALALKHVSAMVQHNKQAQFIYLDAINSMIAQNGVASVQPYLAELDALIGQLLQRPNMPAEEKRDFAYLLINANLKERAQAIFLDLAQGAPADSPDVEQLLDLWGEKPNQPAMDWIIMRTVYAKGTEKKKWMSYVRSKAGAAGVIQAIEADQGEKSPEVMDMYLEAVLESKSSEELAKYITAQIAKNDGDIFRLKRFTSIAIDKNMTAIAESGLRKLLLMVPEDMESRRQLGLLLYGKGSYKDAEKLIEDYLDHEDGDYQIHYAYAQLLWRSKNKEDAMVYTDKALEQLQALPQKDMNSQIMEAQLLYRKGNIQESFASFRELLDHYPENKMLRAEFGNLLMDNKLFTEATTVLKETTP